MNRGTFYTHYKDLYDMLEQMENEMFQELEDMLDSYAPDILRQDFSPILREVFTFVGKNQNLCRVFLARQAVDRFSQRLNSLIYRKCLAEWGALYRHYQELNGLTGPAGLLQLCPGVRGGRSGGPHPGLAGAGGQRVPGGDGPADRAADPVGGVLPGAVSCRVEVGARPRWYGPYRPCLGSGLGAQRPGGVPAGGLHFSCEKWRKEHQRGEFLPSGLPTLVWDILRGIPLFLWPGLRPCVHRGKGPAPRLGGLGNVSW